MTKYQFRYICALLWFILAAVFSSPSAKLLATVVGVVFSLGAIYSAWKERKEARQ